MPASRRHRSTVYATLARRPTDPAFRAPTRRTAPTPPLLPRVDLTAPFRRKSAPALAGVGSGYGGGHAGTTDLYGRVRAPSDRELVREMLGTLYACATLNADAVAATPLRLYVRTTRARRKSHLIDRGETRAVDRRTLAKLHKSPAAAGRVANATAVREVTDHPVLSLLNCPVGIEENGVGMSRHTLLQVTQLYLEVVGRAYWWVNRNGMDRPGELWSLPSHEVQEEPDLTGGRILSEYRFTAGGSGTGLSRLDTADVVPFRTTNLYTGGYLGGWSPARAAYEEIRISRQYKALTTATLENGGRPSAVFAPKGGDDGAAISAPESRRLMAALRQQFAAAGSGGVLVVDLPGTFTQLGYKPTEILTSEQCVQIKAAVANCFRVPTTMLDRAASTLASAKTGDYSHAKDAIVPRLRAMEEALNAFLLPMYEPGVVPYDRQLFFAFDDPEALHDESVELEKLKAWVPLGVLTIDEFRSDLGREPLPGGAGDVRMVANNLVPVDPATGVFIPGAMPAAAPKPGGEAGAGDAAGGDGSTGDGKKPDDAKETDE